MEWSLLLVLVLYFRHNLASKENNTTEKEMEILNVKVRVLEREKISDKDKEMGEIKRTITNIIKNN